jgi:hypothetical protein
VVPRRRVATVLSVLLMLVLLGLGAAALPAYRAWWRAGEASELGAGLALLGERGCMACHATAEGCLRWRSDGETPATLEEARDAILRGRPWAAGFPAAMPAARAALGRRAADRVVLAVGVSTGLVARPDEPEVEAGREVMLQMGCERCHGRLGAGGVPNAGSLAGQVPGWHGRSFTRAETRPGGIEAVIRDGSTPAATPFSGGPALVMPTFHERLDSTELGLLLGALQGARRSVMDRQP